MMEQPFFHGDNDDEIDDDDDNDDDIDDGANRPSWWQSKQRPSSWRCAFNYSLPPTDRPILYRAYHYHYIYIQELIHI